MFGLASYIDRARERDRRAREQVPWMTVVVSGQWAWSAQWAFNGYRWIW
jgi:hypothetical protein